MRKVALILAFFIYEGRARRVQTSSGQLEDNGFAINPTAAFNPSGQDAHARMKQPSWPTAHHLSATAVMGVAEDRLRENLNRERSKLNEQKQIVREMQKETRRIPTLERKLEKQEDLYQKSLEVQEDLKATVQDLKDVVSKQEAAIKESTETMEKLAQKNNATGLALQTSEVNLEKTLETLQVTLLEKKQLQAELGSLDGTGKVTEVLVTSDEDKLVVAQLATAKAQIEKLKAREIQLMVKLQLAEKQIPGKSSENSDLAALYLPDDNVSTAVATANSPEERTAAYRMVTVQRLMEATKESANTTAFLLAKTKVQQMELEAELAKVKEQAAADVEVMSKQHADQLSAAELQRQQTEDKLKEEQKQLKKMQADFYNAEADAAREGRQAKRFQEQLKEAELKLSEMRSSSATLGEQNIALAQERDQLRSVITSSDVEADVVTSVETAEATAAATQALKEKWEADAEEERSKQGVQGFFNALFTS